MKLKGITPKGKDIIQQHGEEWVLIERWAEVGFSEKKGPWCLMRAIGTGEKKWIHFERDQDFEFVKREMKE